MPCVLAVTAWSPGAGMQSRSATTAPAPPAFDVMEKSIEELQKAMQAGEVTSRQLVALYLARIEAYDQRGPRLNAITVLNSQADAAAAALDAERAASGSRGPLHGIPVLVKDNYETVEMPTSAGSVALATFHPNRDAYLVQRLKAAGAVILGKTNMHELAAGITTVGSRFGQTLNPYDLDRNPGGSSGGTGAAVAASFAAAGMGSDTCGSIRNPASHNNLVGLRGTQGLASRTGIVPLSSTQDIGGPIARSVADLAIVLDATVGAEPSDAETASSAGRIPSSYRAALRADALSGARLGIVRELFGDTPDDQEVSRIVQRWLDALKKSGVETIDVTIPGVADLLADGSLINADFKFDLAAYLASTPDAPVKSLAEILDRGLYHAALETNFRARNAVESRDNEQSRRARLKRGALRSITESVIAQHRLTALVYPTLRRKPARIGDAQGGTNCQLSAHSGLPALSVPAGLSDDGLPVGVDLLGPAWSELPLLSLGYAIEQLQSPRQPPFSTPALAGNRPPAAGTATVTLDGARVTMRYEPVRSELHYQIAFGPGARETVAAIWLHSGTNQAPAAARHLLLGPAFDSGVVRLAFRDRADLAEGRLMLRAYRRDGPGGVAAIPRQLHPAAAR